jgi:ABC-2 type transport system ATP-binding protein
MEHVEMFCEELLILVKGKSILQGSLKQIKEDYQKKFIHLIGDIDPNKIKVIKGVENISKTPEEYIIKISSKEIISKVFNVIKNEKNITKFFVEDPTLNEIFVSKVGDILE